MQTTRLLMEVLMDIIPWIIPPQDHRVIKNLQERITGLFIDILLDLILVIILRQEYRARARRGGCRLMARRSGRRPPARRPDYRILERRCPRPTATVAVVTAPEASRRP